VSSSRVAGKKSKDFRLTGEVKEIRGGENQKKV
jgi:hypothetical protein